MFPDQNEKIFEGILFFIEDYLEYTEWNAKYRNNLRIKSSVCRAQYWSWNMKTVHDGVRSRTSWRYRNMDLFVRGDECSRWQESIESDLDSRYSWCRSWNRHFLCVVPRSLPTWFRFSVRLVLDHSDVAFRRSHFTRIPQTRRSELFRWVAWRQDAARPVEEVIIVDGIYQDTRNFVEWGKCFVYWVLIIVILLIIKWSMVRVGRTPIALLTKKLTAISVQ